MQKLLKISFPIVLVFGIISCAFFQRETEYFTESVKLLTGNELKVDRILSSKVYHGGHVFGWGGGDHRNSLGFLFEGVKFKHDTPFIPIVLNYWKNSFYICYFDRETDFYKINYRYYKSTPNGSFEEIDRNNFPKEIAIQNMWLGAGDEGYLYHMDPEEFWFRHSLTARLWYNLESGVPYYSTEEAPSQFLREYKEKYIKKGLTNP